MPKTVIETALSPAQQELIEASIDHLFNFPSTAPNLARTVQEFIAGMKKESNTENVSADIKQLIEIFHKPTEFLFRLETLNDKPVTIADAQDFILSLIKERFEDAAEKACMPLDWPQETLKQAVILPDAQKNLFISKALTVHTLKS